MVHNNGKQSVGVMATTNNEEDFITCGVCFLEYDEEIRKPKFLPCSHTFCLPCLQVKVSILNIFRIIEKIFTFLL